MAPKRSKARESASQPTQEQSMQPRKNTRKRRHSDASNVSDRPSSSQSIATPSVPKRRKRTRASTPEPEVIVEEEEEIVAITNGDEATHDQNIEEDGEVTIEVMQPVLDRHVRFGQSSAGAEDEDISEDELDKATATHITPHPHKMSIKRRATASPTIRSTDGSKRVKVTTSRTSLPANLVADGQDPYYVLEEHHFAPLREVLKERIRRRWALHAGKKERLRELELELKTQAQLGNIERVQELHEYIDELKLQYKDAIVEDKIAEELDEQMLVLDGEETVQYPQLPPQSQTKTVSSLFGRSPLREQSLALTESQNLHEAWNAERSQFQDAIVALSREANEAKTELQILGIELNALGFGSEQVTPSTVVLSIRESFNRIREGMEDLLPGTLPDDVSNQNLIELLLENVKDFADRLHTQDAELQQRTALITDLGQQVHGLVDHLAEAKIRNQKLEQGWSDLDQSNEDKSRKLDNLEDELFKIEEERDGLDEDLMTKTEEVQKLRTENEEFVKSLKRLADSLEKYRAEEGRLTALVERMENEHQETVSSMNRERELTVRELEDQIDKHDKLHSAAELLAEERQTMITGLELRIEDVEEQRNVLEIELRQVKLDRDQEMAGREDAEAELEEKSAEVLDLEGRVDRLEDELANLSTQLEELRQANEVERRQRESAENELDDRNAEVEDLNKRLREQGIQANELRQKLFEVQQLNEQKVKGLEAAASERDEQYQDDIAKEVERRETADDLAQERADRIVTLEERLEQVEIDMREIIALRDERIEVLEEDVAEKTKQIEKLRSELRDAEEQYATQVADSLQERERLEATIQSCQKEIATYETSIASQRQEAARMASLHDSEVEGRNDHIAELNYRVTALSNQISELEDTKASLESRVDTEASNMLQMQAEKDDHIASLESALRDKQEKILIVEQKVRETDQRWEEVLQAREVEIQTLTTSQESTTMALSTMTENMKALKRKFREYVNRSSDRIGVLREELARSQATVEAKGKEALADGDDMLEELAAIAEIGEEGTSASQQTVDNSSQATASSQQIKRVKGRKRRVVDSGIGMDMDAEVE